MRQLITLLFILSMNVAQAQVSLPRLGLPVNPRLPSDINTLREPLKRLLTTGDVGSVLDRQVMRLTNIQQLLSLHPNKLEMNQQGELIVKKEILSWSPSAQSLRIAQTMGLQQLTTTSA